jgi:hypothetical protein
VLPSGVPLRNEATQLLPRSGLAYVLPLASEIIYFSILFFNGYCRLYFRLRAALLYLVSTVFHYMFRPIRPSSGF